MHRRGVAWLLAGAALLACPTSASGSIPAALETFGNAWPQGCPEVTIEQGSDPDPTVSGFATPGTCVIYVTPTFLAQSPRAETICAVVVHEFGHLLGHGHSADENNVMFPSPVPPPACMKYARSQTDEPAPEPVVADAATVTVVKGYQQPTTTTTDARRSSRRSRSCARTAKARAAKAGAKARSARRVRRRSCRA